LICSLRKIELPGFFNKIFGKSGVHKFTRLTSFFISGTASLDQQEKIQSKMRRPSFHRSRYRHLYRLLYRRGAGIAEQWSFQPDIVRQLYSITRSMSADMNKNMYKQSNRLERFKPPCER
jgi:hypothetical protein